MTDHPAKYGSDPAKSAATFAASDADLRRLIETQFPQLGIDRVQPLSSSWDNLTWLVNDKWVFRFPRRELAARAMAIESRLLPQLASRISVPIPEPRWIGQPSESFPWPFAGYAHLEGLPLADVTLNDQQRYDLAEPLAIVLSALHATPRTLIDEAFSGQQTGAALQPHRIHCARDLPKTREGLVQLRQAGVVDDIQPWLPILRNTLVDQRARPGRLVHGDLSAEHLLLDDSARLCGIIDWGKMHAGDVAIDLAVTFRYLTASARTHFRAIYGHIGPSTWQLAQFLSLAAAVRETVDALDQNDDAAVERGVAAMNRIRQ